MTFQEQFDADVIQHLNSLPDTLNEQLRHDFSTNDVVVFEAMLPEALRIKMEDEALSILHHYGVRRDLVIKETGNTPRNFNSVGRDAIAEHGQYIPAFFASEPIKQYLASINNNQTVLPVPYQPEEYIINSQQATGDTHGWHWDDYTFALIWIVEAPRPEEGALIEYIPHTEWDQTDKKNCVQKILDTHTVNSKYIPQGRCYFMKANTTLHRISPLVGSSRRTVIVFTYATEEDMTKDISHETMEQIWAKEIKQDDPQPVGN
ncbi:hypothetical protein [Paenibacillus arenosi]|uniref:Fe2OG dioxygenase domain-containing protein n=1 Tax=Paenibacillus arenosi TaxID=2774142 RepID=A0ABR9B2G4_9BACL|nr:hypothetical protein [Paenibacillus arenosi]MBD8499640.1 hypothetical protein [Paenibacillus arenosi]